MLYNATNVAHVTARNLSIVPGVNSGLSVALQWSPSDLDGEDGIIAGRELISEYISGEWHDAHSASAYLTRR